MPDEIATGSSKISYIYTAIETKLHKGSQNHRQMPKRGQIIKHCIQNGTKRTFFFYSEYFYLYQRTERKNIICILWCTGRVLVPLHGSSHLKRYKMGHLRKMFKKESKKSNCLLNNAL